MATLNIRGLPDDVHATLKEEADASQRSVTAVVLEALREHAELIRKRRRMEQACQRMDRLRESIHRRVGLTSDSVELIREDRER